MVGASDSAPTFGLFLVRIDAKASLDNIPTLPASFSLIIAKYTQPLHYYVSNLSSLIFPVSSPHVSSDNSNPSTSGLQTTDKQNEDSMRRNDDDSPVKENEGSVSDWVSGGPLGSKGAVLVFRSCVLASRTPSMESETKTIGNNTGTTILLNKAKNMARRLVAEPHSFAMRPKNIMHDVMETFGTSNKFNGQAYVVKHVSEANIPETVSVEDQGHELLGVGHKRDIDDVLNDLSKITLKKHLNIENTTANIKPPEEPPHNSAKGKYFLIDVTLGSYIVCYIYL